MTKTGKQRERADSLKSFKRQHILGAARRLFEAQGMDGLNMRAIAAEAGYSLGAAYAYFRTKEEIEAELLAWIISDLTRFIRTSSAGADNPALAGFSFFAQYFNDRPEERKLLLSMLTGIEAATSQADKTSRKELDRRIITLLGLLANNLHRHSAASPTRVQNETMDFFTYLLGLLMLQAGGQLSLLDQRLQEMVDRYGQQMLLRLAQ